MFVLFCLGSAKDVPENSMCYQAALFYMELIVLQPTLQKLSKQIKKINGLKSCSKFVEPVAATKDRIEIQNWSLRLGDSTTVRMTRGCWSEKRGEKPPKTPWK